MIVADLRIVALGEGTSQEKPVEETLDILDERGLKYEVGALGTTVEADRLDDLFNAVRACHAKLKGHAGRLVTQITIDERFDKPETAESLKRVEGHDTGSTTSAGGHGRIVHEA